MKKFALIAAAALMGVSAFADSYTITFKDNGTEEDGTAVLKPAEIAVTDFVAEGVEYVSGSAIIVEGGTSRAYLGKLGHGLKFGNSSKAGNFSVKLSALGTVKPTSIVVSAAAWKEGETAYTTINNIILNEEGLTSLDFADYTITMDGETEVSELEISGNQPGRSYIKSITINYDQGNAFDPAIAHAPRYSAGVPFEAVLGPDLIGSATKTDTVSGAVSTKPCIADKYQWVEYVNPTSTLDNGKAEVQQSNRWTNFDPNYADWNYGEGTTWIQVTGHNGSVNSPVVSPAWGKYMTVYVKETTKVAVLGIGSAGKNVNDSTSLHIVAIASDNSDVQEAATVNGIWGKGAKSDTVSVNLDPTKAYMITIKGDDDFQKDIMIGGLQIYGTSEVPGVAAKATNASFAYFDVVTGPDMVVKGGTKVKTGEDGNVTEKWGIDDNLPWITYVNPTSTLDDGTAEVQVSNRWTDLNPRTGERGEFIQVAGKDGDKNAPVLSPDWGKYMVFQIAGTKKFTVYGAGSASGDETDGNCLKVTATPYNSNEVIEVTSTPGGIWGKGKASDLVSVELDETESYEIKVEAAVKDIQVLGINLLDAEGEANMESGKGTLNLAVEKAAQDEVIDLDGETWTLIGVAATDMKNLTIQNGAVVADSLGQITTKKSIILDGVNIESIVAPVAMAAKETLTAADTLALYTEIVLGYDTVIASIDTTYAEDGAIAAIDTTYAYNEIKGMKYENASNKVFEAELIAIRNSTIKTASSFVSGGNAPWALRNLEVSNSVLETSANSGKAFLNWEEGASQIKDIVIAESTLIGDSVNTAQRFHRYSAQVDPWRVWGYDGEDKNAPGMNTWTLINNTFVNLCGNKEFSNNIKNTAATTFTFKGNIFANCWRLQKLGSNVTREFEATDNVICGGVNTVDGTDATKWATEDANMGITVDNLSPCPYSFTAMMQYGDPDLLVEYIDLTEGITYEFNTEVSGNWYFQAVFANADSVVVAEDAALPIYNAEDLVEPEDEGEGEGEGEETPAPTPIFAVTAAMMNIEGNTVTVNVPAFAESMIPAGNYVVVVPEGSFILYGAADNREHGIANLLEAVEFTIDVPTGIEELSNETNSKVMYNVAGQRVNSAKGIVIVNGKVEMAK